MISLKNISKFYTSRGEKVTLFIGLDWHINAWSFVALMGASAEQGSVDSPLSDCCHHIAGA